jgi:crossover junction endodeoxyribonuclease RuvC
VKVASAGRRRILGIDPGLQRTGFGVIDVQGGRLEHVASGVLRIPVDMLSVRLLAICEGLAAVIAEHHPDEAAIEKVFVNVNPQSTLLLGQARGAAISAAAQAGLAVHEYTAQHVKQAATGYGAAEKAQVQKMVRTLLGLAKAPAADAADALACAICHAHANTAIAAAAAASAAGTGASARRRGSGGARAAWSAFAAGRGKPE